MVGTGTHIHCGAVMKPLASSITAPREPCDAHGTGGGDPRVSMGCWTLSVVFSTNEGLITTQPASDCVPASPEQGRGKLNV